MIDSNDNRELFTKPETDLPPVPDQAVASAQTGASIGARLRAAREAKGLSMADCSSRMHLPVKVLQRLEAGAFGPSVDFVFLRGTLSGYARFLGLPPGSCDRALRAAAPAEQPALVAVARTSPIRWLLQRYGTAATYIVLTATIAVPLVLLGLRGGLERPSTRIVSLDRAPSVVQPSARSRAATGAQAHGGAPSSSPDATPFRASMTPFAAIGLTDADESISQPSINAAPAPADVAGPHTLTVSASADCWFEITDVNGIKVDSGMLHAGDSRTWHAGGALHVTLGNADAVTVVQDGQPLALAAYRHANVARFEAFTPVDGSGEDD